MLNKRFINILKYSPYIVVIYAAFIFAFILFFDSVKISFIEDYIGVITHLFIMIVPIFLLITLVITIIKAYKLLHSNATSQFFFMVGKDIKETHKLVFIVFLLIGFIGIISFFLIIATFFVCIVGLFMVVQSGIISSIGIIKEYKNNKLTKGKCIFYLFTQFIPFIDIKYLNKLCKEI